jgi:hypothetical protein
MNANFNFKAHRAGIVVESNLPTVQAPCRSDIVTVRVDDAAPIDRLGELTWLGPASVVVFGFLLGLIANAFYIQKFDRWMLLLVLGTFTGAYPLMYFAQEFIPLNAAIFISSAIVIVIIAIHSCPPGLSFS